MYYSMHQTHLPRRSMWKLCTHFYSNSPTLPQS